MTRRELLERKLGHHSEGKHRRAIERAMDRAHEHHEMAETHAQKAVGIERQLDNSIFSDDYGRDANGLDIDAAHYALEMVKGE